MTEEFDCKLCGHHVTRHYTGEDQRAKYVAAFGEEFCQTCGGCWEKCEVLKRPAHDPADLYAEARRKALDGSPAAWDAERGWYAKEQKP